MFGTTSNKERRRDIPGQRAERRQTAADHSLRRIFVLSLTGVLHTVLALRQHICPRARPQPRVTCCAPRPDSAARKNALRLAALPRSRRSGFDRGLRQAKSGVAEIPAPSCRVQTAAEPSLRAFFVVTCRAAPTGRGTEQVTRRQLCWRRARAVWSTPLSGSTKMRRSESSAARDRTGVARSRKRALSGYFGVAGLAGAAAGAALVVAGGFGIQKAGSDARTSFET